MSWKGLGSEGLNGNKAAVKQNWGGGGGRLEKRKMAAQKEDYSRPCWPTHCQKELAALL